MYTVIIQILQVRKLRNRNEVTCPRLYNLIELIFKPKQFTSKPMFLTTIQYTLSVIRVNELNTLGEAIKVNEESNGWYNQ